MNYYVYEITNLVNGKKYIGKRSCKCPIEDDKYMGSGIAITNAIQKYGIGNFKKDILRICETEDEAYLWEERYIALVSAWNNSNYYNLKAGGKGGTTHMSDATREKLKAPKSDEHKRKIGEAHKGKYVSEVTRNKFRVLFSGERYKGENNPFYGKTHSDEVIQKIRNANIGRKDTAETRLKKSIATSGENNPMYGRRGKDAPSAKAVYCITTDEVFDCIKHGADKYGLDRSSVSKCCRGKLNTCGKLNGIPLKWIYYDDYIKVKQD